MAKKRSTRKRGTGYASQAKNGTWTAFYPRFGGGYLTRRGFDTRALAEAWLDSLVAREADKQNISKGQQLTGEWTDTWKKREARERNWKAKSIADVEFKLGYTKPFIGDMALADVDPDHVDAMLDTLAKDLAESTVRQIRNYLWQVFEAAVERRYIRYNPVLKPRRRKRAKQKPPQRLSAPQMGTLLIAASASDYELAYWLIVCCAFRAGEICGLRRSDVDLENAVINIAQEYTDLRGKPHQDTPKGDKTRDVPFPRPLVPAVRAQLDKLTKRAARNAETWQEHTLVFPGRGGRPMNTTSLRHNLHDLTDAAKLPSVTTHMLRHTSSSLLTDVGCPKDLRAKILGHGPESITDHYSHPEIETLRPWVEKVYRLLLGEVEEAKKRNVT